MTKIAPLLRSGIAAFSSLMADKQNVINASEIEYESALFQQHL
jgi:hypothetical protein